MQEYQRIQLKYLNIDQHFFLFRMDNFAVDLDKALNDLEDLESEEGK